MRSQRSIWLAVHLFHIKGLTCAVHEDASGVQSASDGRLTVRNASVPSDVRLTSFPPVSCYVSLSNSERSLCFSLLRTKILACSLVLEIDRKFLKPTLFGKNQN